MANEYNNRRNNNREAYNNLTAGEGANGRIAMGTAVVGGMLISTIMTMYVVPAIYSYISTDQSKQEEKQ